jgi:hypothetical protein|tara:strand:- start:3668 stop:4543 length:876 start_codon:yes stop_codon:yes gene_type:complete
MEGWRKYLKEIDITDPDTTRVIDSPDPDLGKVKVSKEDFDNLQMVIGLFDPTGISAYPDIPPAIDEFNKYRNVFAAANLAVALAAAVPILGKAGNAIKAILKLRKTSKSLQKVAGKSPNVARSLNQANQTLKVLPKPSQIRDRATTKFKPNRKRKPASANIRSNAYGPMTPGWSKKLKKLGGSSDTPRQKTPQMQLLDQSGDSHEWLDKEAIKSIPPLVRTKFLKAQKEIRRKVKQREKGQDIGKLDTIEYIPDPLIPSIYDKASTAVKSAPINRGKTIATPPPIPTKKKK